MWDRGDWPKIVPYTWGYERFKFEGLYADLDKKNAISNYELERASGCYGGGFIPEY